MDSSRASAEKNHHEEQTHIEDGITNSLVVLTFLSAISGFLFGYDTGVISGAMLLIRKDFKLSTLWQELIVSSAIVAAWISALVAGPLADFFGRKMVILGSSVIFVAGSVILGLAQGKWTLFIGRIIVGLGIGSSSMCSPVYISEVATLSSRGRLTVTNTVFLTGGQFVSSVICGLFSSVNEGWRWMLGLGALPAFIQLIGFVFTPESPRWLALLGRVDESRDVLQKFRPVGFDYESEIEGYGSIRSQETASLKSLFGCHTVRRALFLGCLLQLFQQIAGINTVMYYSASIIAMAGVNDEQTAIWLAALTSSFNFLFTLVGLWLVERVGRRPLTLGSLVGVTVALLSLALSFQLVYMNSSPITNHNEEDKCSTYTSCSSCTFDPDCGFCFQGDKNNVQNSSCLLANHTQYNEVSTSGLCVDPEDNNAIFAYNWCPSRYAWMSVLGLCLYLCFFAPGMGCMPWTINSEIYPSWARARCNSIATSVNWGANLVVSLSFLSLMEILTKHGAFYLYMCLALAGFVTFYFILPETRGVKLEEVENLFQRPLCYLQPWKKGDRANELTSSASNVLYGSFHS